MAHSPLNRPPMSVSTTNLGPTADARPRRMTASSLPPPSPLNLPEPVVVGYRRPPSPLRNGHTVESDDASTASHDRQREQRSHSPSPSVAKFAANFAQRVGSFVSNISPRANGLPTDDELEAEAERERERSRREAERIMMQEAEDKRTMEERVAAMLNGGSASGSPKSLPPPPSRSQTMPGTPPSPATSQKDGSWWSVAKSRLTPTKEPLTPAQQVIQETKAREKEQEKEKKRQSKMKQKSKEWPAAPDSKFDDPAFIKLGLSASPTQPIPIPRATSASPSSPAAHQRFPSTPPSLSTSPFRSNEQLRQGEPGSSSPSRQPPPLYAQFNAQGILDVPGTLLTIAKRFEKLERWTVGHVRALEERMDDVERWLVEKEKEKESPEKTSDSVDTAAAEASMSEVREELAEMQGRVGELGREMAKLIAAGSSSSGPARPPGGMARAASTTSIAVRSISQSMVVSPTSTPPRGSTSPPVTTPAGSSRTSRTRLPYPTGDYATPPETAVIGQAPFSPSSSPPSSITSSTRPRQSSISGLPAQSTSSATSISPAGIPQSTSPMPMNSTDSSIEALPPPTIPAARTSSVSPTPRKRYTVALGGPIMDPSRAERTERERPSTPHSRGQSRELSTAFFSTSPPMASLSNDETTDDSDGGNEETIGKAASRQSGLTRAFRASGGHARPPSATPSEGSTQSQRRSRPLTKYTSNIAAPAPVTPLNVRLRSRSSDRFGLGITDSPVTPTTSKFVDPLVVRRQTKEAMAGATLNQPKVMPGKPKVPVGELVAFFDQENCNT
ncbi:hypothetical protein WOLCODRAFT_92162 [Wolfiporia cocos MD-104 SS10]|uniref:Uncharacterized protein n=1 Tax=Wolfiporia cocos (strain MD-104) TaxID=742152 RepID=A0A2H3JLH6_WOLCO|nr:hypothetical protein WOLCODRAFT_92162 [Wolfiporia cocos MD-104 SS10]